VTKAVGALALLSVLNVLLNSIPKISENVTLAATMPWPTANHELKVVVEEMRYGC